MKWVKLADLNPPSLSLSFQTTLFWFKRFLYYVFSKVPQYIHAHRLTAVLLVACSQSFKLGLEAPSTIQLNPVAQLSRKRYETTLGWKSFVDDSKWNNAGALGFLLGYISWWIGHFLTNSYFNHVRIHAHWDFPGRRTCYQDLPSSGHRTNTIPATCRNHKKKHMSDAKSTKSDSTASCLSAAPAMLSHGWKHWIRLDPRWRFEGIG